MINSPYVFRPPTVARRRQNALSGPDFRLVCIHLLSVNRDLLFHAAILLIEKIS